MKEIEEKRLPERNNGAKRNTNKVHEISKAIEQSLQSISDRPTYQILTKKNKQKKQTKNKRVPKRSKMIRNSQTNEEPRQVTSSVGGSSALIGPRISARLFYRMKRNISVNDGCLRRLVLGSTGFYWFFFLRAVDR